MWTFFGENQELFQYLVFILESLEELDFNPDTIVKLKFPETPPLTYPNLMVNLTLSYA